MRCGQLLDGPRTDRLVASSGHWHFEFVFSASRLLSFSNAAAALSLPVLSSLSRVLSPFFVSFPLFSLSLSLWCACGPSTGCRSFVAHPTRVCCSLSIFFFLFFFPSPLPFFPFLSSRLKLMDRERRVCSVSCRGAFFHWRCPSRRCVQSHPPVSSVTIRSRFVSSHPSFFLPFVSARSFLSFGPLLHPCPCSRSSSQCVILPPLSYTRRRVSVCSRPLSFLLFLTVFLFFPPPIWFPFLFWFRLISFCSLYLRRSAILFYAHSCSPSPPAPLHLPPPIIFRSALYKAACNTIILPLPLHFIIPQLPLPPFFFHFPSIIYKRVRAFLFDPSRPSLSLLFPSFRLSITSSITSL